MHTPVWPKKAPRVTHGVFSFVLSSIMRWFRQVTKGLYLLVELSFIGMI